MKFIVIVLYSQIRVLPYLTWTFFNLRPWEEGGGGAGMMAPHNNFGILAQKLLRHYYDIVMTS